MEKTGRLVVYKFRGLSEDRGVVKPILFIDDEGRFKSIDDNQFPSGILISKGYAFIEEKYEDGRFFILNEANKDEQKSLEDRIDRYWAFGRDAVPLPPSTLMPVIKCKLPPVETGQLPETIKAPQGIFFVLDDEDNKLYGPARATSIPEENYLMLEAEKTPKLSFDTGYLGVFDTRELGDILIKLNINDQDLYFLSSLNDLSSRRYTLKDFISDRALIRSFSRHDFGRNSKSLSRKEADRLSTLIINAEKMHRNVNNQDGRLQRFKKILDRYLNETDVGYKTVIEYFSTPDGNKFLKKYVEENQEKLLGDKVSSIKNEVEIKEADLRKNLFRLDEQIESKQKELDFIQSSVDKEKSAAEKRIQDIKDRADEEIQANMRSREQELQKNINKLEIEKEQKSKELNEICEHLGLANNLNAMHRKDIYFQENNKILEAAAKGFQDQLQNTDELAKRISEYHVIGQVLKGVDVTKDTRFEYVPVDFSSSRPANAADLIDKIRSYLEWDEGKSFSNAELSNIMICLSQSFLTVLAGSPGVGKTSTVIRLAQALKLGAPDEHKNFLYMPVSRGWVSSRDILGFYNSLTSVYQRARTGLYDFLRREDDGTKALQLILLDESNLSPMEHYWADFLGMCDKEGRSRPIETGIPHDHDRFLRVRENVRFVATINYDSTTERLSPRLIDRVPIISIDHEDDMDYGYESKDLKLDGALEYSLLDDFFNDLKDADLSDVYLTILNNLIYILGENDPDLGQPIIISHRKRAAIIKYCIAAISNELMEPDTALDFAISQYMLPHFEGYGPKFRNRISKFAEVLGKGYPRTSKHIERIVMSGNDFTGTYSFF